MDCGGQCSASSQPTAMKIIISRLLALMLWLLFLATQRAKDGLRSMDMTTNCLWFSGSPYESVSSHAWRECCSTTQAWWACVVMLFTGLFVADHCKQANVIEQPIVDFVAKQ